MKEVPITERANAKSVNIDVQEPSQILQILFDCEGEIFGGFQGSRGVLEEAIIVQCLTVSKAIREAIVRNGFTTLVLVGAGTSGRLCRLISRILEPLCRGKVQLVPIIAGGIKALVRAEPNTEDRFETGVNDFIKHTKDIDRSNCGTIGVSCGLSANYVKGALASSIEHGGYCNAVIGFNPAEQSTINMCQDEHAITLINPIIGPEAIVGSVRMKGGTATMMLLYALISCAFEEDTTIREQFHRVIDETQVALTRLISVAGEVAQLVARGGRIIRQGGKIHLLGNSVFGTLCIYDAAECPPTFGATSEQVNGYIEHGIEDLAYYDSEIREQLSKEISAQVFVTTILPHLSPDDLIVVIIGGDGELSSLFRTIVQSEHEVVCVACRNNPTVFDHYTSYGSKRFLLIESLPSWNSVFQQLIFVRSLLIQLSTGSFTLSGKIFENKMIDLRITNKKLYNRALRIVSQITREHEDVVCKRLLNVIYEGSSWQDKPLDEHIRVAATREAVVPKTILALLYPSKGLDEINSMLTSEPIVRKLIMQELRNADASVATGRTRSEEQAI